MRVGVPKEIKTQEHRVGLTPGSVRELAHHGHEVLVQHHAGHDIGLDDEEYQAAGATIVADAAEIFATADMVVKVKEPQPAECAMLRDGQVLFTYLHLAPDRRQTKALVDSGAVCVAYETVTDEAGGLPLLSPMSEVAGRMSIQAGAHCLEITRGGRGVLLGGVPGVLPAKVVIVGGGVVGTNAARMAMGLEASVYVIDKNLRRLYELDLQFGVRLNTVFSTVDHIDTHVTSADLVVGAVLLPGGAAPKLITEDMVKRMKRGAVFVDVSIDQGGCAETSRPTTHDEPTYVEHGVVHYCVTNMPGAVAGTSTAALNNATLPFVLALANKGWQRAMREDVHLKRGLNVAHGKITYEAVARDQGLDFTPPDTMLGA